MSAMQQENSMNKDNVASYSFDAEVHNPQPNIETLYLRVKCPCCQENLKIPVEVENNKVMTFVGAYKE